MSGFKSLFGDKLVDQAGKTVDPASLDKMDGVLVYFSAHWCPPCKAFTPQLVKTVKKMKADGKKCQAVFVSSDRDASSFNNYFGSMEGFLALPYSDRALKEKLSQKYKVQGIPTLVVLNSKAETITTDGRRAVMMDGEGKKFPWLPPTFHELFGSTFLARDGSDTKEVSSDALKGKTVGIYFSASWCQPCRQFTPELIKTYKALTAAGKPFEVVFSSSCKTYSDFKGYYASMPWMAIPFPDADRREGLDSYFKVEGVPTFVVVDYDSGKILQKEGRMAVLMDPTGADFPWKPKPVETLSRMTANKLNEGPCLIAFLGDKTSSEQEKKVYESMAVVSKETKEKKDDDEDSGFTFFIAKADMVVQRVRSLFGDSYVNSSSLVVGIVDVQSGAVAVGTEIKSVNDISEAKIRDVYSKYQAGSLKKFAINMDED